MSSGRESDRALEVARARFRQVDGIIDAAIDLQPDERRAYSLAACDGDHSLLHDVERLLCAHERSTGVLDGGAAHVAGDLLDEALSASRVAAADALRARLQGALGAAYQLTSHDASGGMATVFLAHDVRHDRPVAVKVLDIGLGVGPDAGLDSGPGARGSAERFLGEIRIMARLQHPNLLPLFDSGAADGLLYYVMPYVESETLRQQLERAAPFPVEEAVRIATLVASAMAHAHAAGVIHRDLKPENILMQGGQPMVADFGIALAHSRTGGERLTGAGVAVGTPQYMAPEQARGDAVIDARTDIYSLGAVLYELLTGDPPHVASTPQLLLARVLAERPTDIRVLRPTVPAEVAAAVARALAKLPVDRFASMGEFAEALAGRIPAADVVPALGAGPSRRGRGRFSVPAVLIAAAALLSAVGIAGWRWIGADTERLTTTRFVVAPIADAAIGRAPTITPDGRQLVYPGSAATGRRLFVRPVGELQARSLPGTEGALSAFVAPDGRSIGFFTSDDRLKTVSIDGGPVTLRTGAFRFSRAVWGPDGRIVLSAYGRNGLDWLRAGSEALHALTRFDPAERELRHAAPIILGDGATVVFTVERDRDGPAPTAGELAVATLRPDAPGPDRHTLLGVRARSAIAMVGEWLLYTGFEGQTVMAVRFDAAQRTVSGDPLTVLEDPRGGIVVATLADNGTLLYTRQGEANTPVLVDGDGVPRPLFDNVQGGFMNPRLSPDGRRLLLQGQSAEGTDVWVYDVASGTPTRLTTTGMAVGPSWSPDGRHVVYFSTRTGRPSLWWHAADGSTPPEHVVEADGAFAPLVAPDGRTLLFQRQRGGRWGIWAAERAPDPALRPVVVEPFDSYMPALSPDGRWLAYAANPSGRSEIYVRPYPGPGAAVQLSDSGGTEPAWAPDGSRLFYRGDRQMLAVTLTTVPTLAVTSRRRLFREAFDGDMPMPHRNYDITADGQRFVMIASAESAGTETIVVLGWLTELRRRLASAR